MHPIASLPLIILSIILNQFRLSSFCPTIVRCTSCLFPHSLLRRCRRTCISLQVFLLSYYHLYYQFRLSSFYPWFVRYTSCLFLHSLLGRCRSTSTVYASHPFSSSDVFFIQVSYLPFYSHVSTGIQYFNKDGEDLNLIRYRLFYFN